MERRDRIILQKVLYETVTADFPSLKEQIEALI